MIRQVKIFVLIALMTSTAAICVAQSWDDDSGWDDGGWEGEEANSWDGGWEGGESSGWDNSGWQGGDDNSGSSNDGGNVQYSASWGSPAPAEITSGDESIFPSSISESSSMLIEETSSIQYDQAGARGNLAYSMAAGGNSKNIFWIVSRDGSQNWRSVNIPCHRYARLFFIPSASGQLIMEELYPNNQVRTYHFGNVVAYKTYRAWFFADTSGTHRMRYKINNGPYSDILTFYVGNCGGGGSGGVCPCCGRPY